MATKKILILITNDRYCYPLLQYLSSQGKTFGWKTRVGCLSNPSASERIAAEKFPVPLDVFQLAKVEDCDQAVRKSDVVIALLSDAMLLHIADSCVAHRKILISPSRLTRQMALKKETVADANTLLLMDCGFSPGLDHITARMAIDNIHSRGGQITSFKTCSGSYIPDEAEENPFQFKLSEPAADLLGAGRHTNRYLVDGHVQQVPSCRLFEQSGPMSIPDIGKVRVVPEGDSLYYRNIYDLENARTVARGKIYPEGFDNIWNVFVRLGLTDPLSRIDLCGDASFSGLLDSLLPYAPSLSIEQRLAEFCEGDRSAVEKFRWLGLLDDQWVHGKKAVTPAFVLEYLLERRLYGAADDRDCVIMRHDIEYEFRNEQYRLSATFTAKGDNMRYSALARAIGYTCGAAAKSVLLGTIASKGVQIPVAKDIYDPLLNELEELGIAFRIEDHKSCAEAVASSA